MHRRQFLGLLGAGIATGCAEREGSQQGTGHGAGTTTTTSGSSEAPGTGSDDLALEDRLPRSLATTDDAELDVTLTLLDGELPSDWTGHAFWVHPIPQGAVPVFVGEGKVLRLDLGDEVTLTSRIVRTPDHYADLATLGHPDGFVNNGFVRESGTLGYRNFPNTALVALGDRLLATSDGGRPWELDPVTLEAVTPMGWRHEWQDVLPIWVGWFVDWPFSVNLTSAHLAVDHEAQQVFTVNYGPDILGSAFTRVVRWDGSGGLDHWQLLDQATGLPVALTQSAHQLVVTRNHVVVMDTAFVVESGMGGEPDLVPQLPDTTLWIVRRSDLGIPGLPIYAQRVTLPREAVHFHADFEDAQGIVLHVAHNPGADASEMVEPGDVHPNGTPVDPALFGLPCAPTDLGAAARYVLDPTTGTVVDSNLRYDAWFWGGPALSAFRQSDRHTHLFWANAGFSTELQTERIQSTYADHPYREVAIADLPESNIPGALICVDSTTLEVVDGYTFPAGRAGLSPVFVPREGTEGPREGYLLCTVISDDTDTEGSSGDEFWVFDASDLAAGPVARLGHTELNMPFTLHTLYMPTVAPRTAAYQVDVRADLAPSVNKLSPELQQMFEDAVYPHFS